MLKPADHRIRHYQRQHNHENRDQHYDRYEKIHPLRCRSTIELARFNVAGEDPQYIA